MKSRPTFVRPGDEEETALCGEGHNWDGVTITPDQYHSILTWAGIPLCSPDSLAEAQASVAAMREAKHHGMRMVALIAPLLEPGYDPVEWLSELLEDMGYAP